MTHHRSGPSYPGTVVLELGDGTGVVIIRTGPESLGHEIEIVSRTSRGLRTHAEVRERRLKNGTIYCAVITGVPAGEYIVVHGTEPTIAVHAGDVTQIEMS